MVVVALFNIVFVVGVVGLVGVVAVIIIGVTPSVFRL
jgi:hypothetical protein